MTLGPAVARTSELIGKPFMPWQRLIADVTGEIDPETGLLAYDEVGVTVMRQQGKTTLLLAKNVHRATATGFFGPRQHMVYTAQTRQDARKKWEEEFVPELKAAKRFAGRWSASWANGNEHIRFQNGSRWGIEATTEKGGHGAVLDSADIDEAFAAQDGRSEQAFLPAMITRRNTQLWWVSTAGWSDGSPYLTEKVRVGRAAVENGVRRGLAYFEWSADPDCDPSDPSVWWGCMPALGHTITEAKVATAYDKALREDRLADFLRANLNIWVPKPVLGDEGSPLASWSLRRTDEERVGRPLFGIEVANQQASAAIGVCGTTRAGVPRLALAAFGDGSGWVVDWCVENRVYQVALDSNGAAESLVGPLEAAGISVVSLKTSDAIQTCASLQRMVIEGGVLHADDKPLNDAAAACRRRDVGDKGGWVFGRKASGGADIVPLQAAAWAFFLWSSGNGGPNLW